MRCWIEALAPSRYLPAWLAALVATAVALAQPYSSSAAALSINGPDAATVAVDRLLARMTLQQKIGQLVMAPPDSVAATGRLGGVILAGPNVVSPDQGRTLIAALQRMEPIPMLVAADQEGGAVSTMSAGGGVPAALSPAQYGTIGSPAQVYRDALRTGRALRALGVTMDLAPVLDVLTDPQSPIGSRSYGSDPSAVAALGVAAVRGYQDGGVAATAKHFLGLGTSSLDAHVTLPTDARSLEQIEHGELVPFRAAIKAGVDALMVTDVAIPALDPSGTPATLSRPIISGFIRGRLGYRGVIITDSLSMGGLGAHIASVQSAALRAIEAGADMVLIDAGAPTINITLITLDHAAFTGQLSVAAITASARRVLTLKARLGLLSN